MIDGASGSRFIIYIYIVRLRKTYPEKIHRDDIERGIPFIMITKQGSLSIIKTISKIEGCTLRTGPYARILRRQDKIRARETLNAIPFAVCRGEGGEIIIKRYRSSHVEELKFRRSRMFALASSRRYLYIVTSVT